MKNVTPFPTVATDTSSDVVMLSCRHQMHFDPAPLSRLFAERDIYDAEEIVCRMLEDIARRLDMLQNALASNDFASMARPARRVASIADQMGLSEMSIAVGHVTNCLQLEDGVALEATMARLERGFDVAVSEVWNFRDL